MKDCVKRLVDEGIPFVDACDLRKVAMTLQKWHEKSCGWEDGGTSFCITRGKKVGDSFEYDEEGEPHVESHPLRGGVYYKKIADKERGALARLKIILNAYKNFVAFVQQDPRGAPLYIIHKDKLRERDIETCYSDGIAVYK